MKYNITYRIILYHWKLFPSSRASRADSTQPIDIRYELDTFPSTVVRPGAITGICIMRFRKYTRRTNKGVRFDLGCRGRWSSARLLSRTAAECVLFRNSKRQYCGVLTSAKSPGFGSLEVFEIFSWTMACGKLWIGVF